MARVLRTMARTLEALASSVPSQRYRRRTGNDAGFRAFEDAADAPQAVGRRHGDPRGKARWQHVWPSDASADLHTQRGQGVRLADKSESRLNSLPSNEVRPVTQAF